MVFTCFRHHAGISITKKEEKRQKKNYINFEHYIKIGKKIAKTIIGYSPKTTLLIVYGARNKSNLAIPR
jgi:hypothetical protein